MPSRIGKRGFQNGIIRSKTSLLFTFQQPYSNDVLIIPRSIKGSVSSFDVAAIADLQSVLSQFVATGAETAAATDTPSSGVSTSSSQSETAATSSTESAVSSLPVSVAESTAVTDTPSATFNVSSASTESVATSTAQDSTSVSDQVQTETAAAADSPDSTGGTPVVHYRVGSETEASNVGSSTSIVVNKGIGQSAGDLILIMFACQLTTTTITWPSGFTQILSVSIPNPITQFGMTLGLAYKFDGGSEPSTYTVSRTGGGGSNNITLSNWQNVNTVTPYTLSSESFSNPAASPLSMALTGLTATEGDALILLGTIGMIDPDQWSTNTPSGFTFLYEKNNNSLYTYQKFMESQAAGATGTKTVTATRTSGASNAGWAGYQLALKSTAAVSSSASAAETVATSDTRSATAVFTSIQAETLATAEASSNVVIFGAIESESTATSTTESAVQTTSATGSETTATSTTQSTGGTLSDSTSDSAAITETSSSANTTAAASTDSTATSDTRSATFTATATTTNSTAATEASDSFTGVFLSASQAETTSTSENSVASVVFNAIVAEISAITHASIAEIIPRLVKRVIIGATLIRALSGSLSKRNAGSSLTERDVDGSVTKRNVSSSLTERKP